MSVTGDDLTVALAEAGFALPDGHQLVTLVDRPDVASEVERFGSSVWPEFMLHDTIADDLWMRMAADWPEFQLALLDGDGALVSVARSAPLAWQGTVDDLPRGWDEQFTRSVAQLDRGVAVDTLGSVMAVSDPARRGHGLGRLMVSAMRQSARLHGLRALIACVRPTLLERYPLTPIDEYARWTRDDGLPFDPWIRIHVRLGGRLSRPEPASMLVVGTIAQWERWTELAFPASGRYVVPGACAPVDIDRQADEGTYLDPNVWVIHDLA